MPAEDFDMTSALAQLDAVYPGGSENDDDTIDDPSLVTEATNPAAATSAAQPALDENGNPITADPADPDPAPPSALAAPKTWRKEAVEKWAALDPVAQAEILKREEDMFKGLEGYKGDAEYGRNFKTVMQPYDQILRQYNIDPVQQVNNLMQSHYTLAFGTPQQKVELVQQIIKDYGIELPGFEPGEKPYEDPAVEALRREVQELQSHRQQSIRAQQQQARSRAESEIAAFSADPKNVHFNDVSADMTRMLASGSAKTLQEAYDAAIWLNPIVRQKELDRQTAEKAAQKAKDDAEHAAKAKAASAANVRTRAKSGSGTAPTGSMDDTISEALAAIKARG